MNPPCKQCILYASCRAKYHQRVNKFTMHGDINTTKSFALYNLAKDCSLFRDYISYILGKQLDSSLPSVSMGISGTSGCSIKNKKQTTIKSPSSASFTSSGFVDPLQGKIYDNIEKFRHIFEG